MQQARLSPPTAVAVHEDMSWDHHGDMYTGEQILNGSVQGNISGWNRGFYRHSFFSASLRISGFDMFRCSHQSALRPSKFLDDHVGFTNLPSLGCTCSGRWLLKKIPVKNMESVGMMTFPRYGKSSKKMFEITNQCCISQKPMAYFKTKKCMIHKSGSLLIFFATINIGLMAPGRNV